MLINFHFKNFKSFKNVNTLKLQASAFKEHEETIIETKMGNFLKVSAIYGANASGKTNVLQAFAYMRNLVLMNEKSNHFSSDITNISNNLSSVITGVSNNNYSAITNVPNNAEKSQTFFRIKEEPILLEVEIYAKNNQIYKYGFEILDDKIISEWLLMKGINKFFNVFERKENSVKLKQKGRKISHDDIDDNTLFLTLYSKMNKSNENFNQVYNWFKTAKYVDLNNYNLVRNINNKIALKVLNDEIYRKKLLKYMQIIDKGIKDITTNLKTLKNLEEVEENIKLEFIHNTEDNAQKTLPLELESSGTQKMVHLFAFLMDSLKNGTTLFIDELDTKLHPLLIKYIINLFHNSETNLANGQLIYSTHDVTNLNNSTFRRDEIWFVEKDDEGNSKIYSLADYKINNTKVRNDASYQKDYLAGKYGAVPILIEFKAR